MDERVWIGDNLVTFDGAVLELFGHPATPSARFHVEALDLTVTEPDRKDRRTLTLKAAVPRSGGVALEIGPEDWPQARPFLDRVLDAMPGS